MIKLTKNQRRYLSKLFCAWCDMRLDCDGCAEIWKRCTPQQQEKRRELALQQYRPRKKKA